MAGFFLGSLIAAFVQGAAVGTMVQELPVVDGRFAGGSFVWLTPFSVLCGVGSSSTRTSEATSAARLVEQHVASFLRIQQPDHCRCHRQDRREGRQPVEAVA